MGYYTQFEVEVPEEFMALWDMNRSEIEEHVEALKKLGISVDPETGPMQITDDVSISTERGDKIFDIGMGYQFTHTGDRTFHSEGQIKFYEWKEAFTKLSKEVTGLFTVTGDGEEGGDMWRAYFQCGKSYEVRPTFPEFDEFKLT